ncbi:choline/glycine/proline betaine transport protein [Catalinimonas alkaloidigena]|uniref:BCCT family transporter n=1 Tax=Catalinimonas alkaloidigena TaxID=1075417 RepID=UPI002406E7C6|nr:BCCT family transporter [Catalinimonas alkaloidigena]MDF9798712.1 choline/glycine/proline betaine transport protein [Catalinimonas alkaloidigena]
MSSLNTFLKKFTSRMQPVVFGGAAATVLIFVLAGSLFPKHVSDLFGQIQTFIINDFGWFYVLSASAILLFVIYLMIGPLSHIRLGGDGARPDFNYFTWFTMLFSAGMGTGLVFWSVAEPLNHYHKPPLGEGESYAALREAFQFTFFHWGLHPWAIYALFGLGIAYYHFRIGLPLAPRSLFYPLFGDKIFGWLGHFIDILATVGTLFGVATSLGLGAMQINSGLSILSQLNQSTGVQVIIIATITLVATISVVLGLDKGISRLSRFNVLLAFLLLVFVFVAGPSVYLLNTLVTGIGTYLQQLPFSSFWVNMNSENTWQADWTLFYWAWWISWSPFVGIFVARISKGRTVREFIMGVLFVPTLATFIWLSVFGGTALFYEIEEGVSLFNEIEGTPSIALHRLLQELPFSTISLIFATLLITIFFITSSDSGSFVDDMVTSGGHPNPPVGQKVFWAVSEGAVAATLLLSGGLDGLRSASLTSGLPMTILLLMSGAGLYKALSNDHKLPNVPKAREIKKKLTEKRK